jgi:hypothetical protein
MNTQPEILIEKGAHSGIAAQGTPEQSSIEQSVASIKLPAAFEQAGTCRDFSYGKSDAALQGALVLSGLRSGTLAVIEAGVRTAETVRRHQHDPESIDVFMATLAEGKLFSDRERKLGLASPKLSKIRSIGDHAPLLRRDEILEHFIETGSTGYSVVYPLLVLYRTIQGDDEARFEQLVTLLRAQRPSTRKEFSDLTQEAKKAKVQTNWIPEQGAAFEDGRAQFDLIFARLNNRGDLRRLGDDHADKLPRCLRIHERVSEDAFAIVVARLADLPIVENKLLPGFGFASISRVFLLRNPHGADVTDEQVVVIATLSGRSVDRLPDFQWLPDDDPVDADTLALRLVPDAKNKLHVFAAAESEGWCAIVGEANWSQADE